MKNAATKQASLEGHGEGRPSKQFLRRVVADILSQAAPRAPEQTRAGQAGGRRIALLACGSRGDIQPVIVVGDELRRRGHSVVMTVNVNMVGWAQKSGLEIVPLPLDTESFLKSDAGRAMLANGQFAACAAEMGRMEREANAEIDRAITRACAGADLIVSTLITAVRATAHAEATGIPHRLLSTMPVHKTGAYAHVMSPVQRFPLRVLNRWSYELIRKMWWKNLVEPYGETRAALRLPPSSECPAFQDLPSVSIYSQALLPDDSDRSAQHAVAGFPQLSAELREKLGEGKAPEGLLEWIAAGDAPVFFGFGSMPVQDPQALVKMVAEITARRGLRALIGAGWSDYDSSELPAHVRIAPAFDHDRVLPLCRAAVHHGGAGTTAASLRAGLPTLIVSCAFDQPFWGWRLTQLGVGATLRFQRLTAARLDAGLSRILAPEVAARAKSLGERLRAEPGASNAADVIEGWLSACAPRALCA